MTEPLPPQELDFTKIAWDAYSKAVGGVTFGGKPLPDWKDVGEKQKAGWQAAIEAVFEAAYAADNPPTA